MERILSVLEMREADKYTIEKLGISSQTLIERAGYAVAEEISYRFKGGRVLVCCGKGNNGEDGKIVARVLSSRHGFTVATVNVVNGIFKLFDKKYDIIVDCIFGTGLNKEVDGKFKTAIEKINSSGAYVVSCDIPSGISGDNGRVLGVAVKANLTVAIQEYKLGHFFGEGALYSGEVVAKDIGISIWGEGYAFRLTDEEAKKYFSKRPKNVNKGNFGKVSVLGGSINFPGGIMLSLYALTALKTGVGYSNLAIPESLYNAYAVANPECTITTVKDEVGNIIFDKEKMDELCKHDAVAFGMGLGVSEGVYQNLKYLLENYTGKLLIDADGLNSLAKYGVDILKTKKCAVLITPHIKEFSRLCNVEVSAVLENPIEKAKAFAKEYSVTVLLKNFVSVITDGLEVCINTVGSSGLAKAGSGDVLSGFIAGLMGRGLSVNEAAYVGAYIFGKAGAVAEKESNEYTMTATDVIKALPEVINSL